MNARRLSLWLSVAGGSCLVAGTFALLAVLAIRFGGIVGSAVVLVITGMTLLASMLTIGIFLAPGILLLDASAWAAIVDRGEQRRLGSLPAPPPPPPPPGVVAE